MTVMIIAGGTEIGIFKKISKPLRFAPRTSSETDRLWSEKKQFREFLTAVKGILCASLIYLRLKTTNFWVTYVMIKILKRSHGHIFVMTKSFLSFGKNN